MKLTIWHVLALAVIVSAMLISSGKWDGGRMVFVILGFILLGAIYPPLAVGIGILAILRLIMANPTLAKSPVQSFTDTIQGTEFTSYIPQRSQSNKVVPNPATMRVK